MVSRILLFVIPLTASAICVASSCVVLAQPAKIGPSFDCTQAHDALSSLICGSDTLSWTDLRFVQAYQALRHQVGEAGQPGVRQEAIDFQTQLYAVCRLPRAGLIPPPLRPRAEVCALQNYQRQRDLWASRLSPPLQEEVNRPLQQHLKLQAILQGFGYIPPTSAIDGVYGPATRTAITAWQITNNLPPTGILSASDAGLLLQSTTNTQLPAPSQMAPPAITSTLSYPPLDEKVIRAAEERRLEVSKAEATRAKAEAEKAQAEAERAQAEAEIYAAKERAEAEAHRKAAELAQAEQDAHGIQP